MAYADYSKRFILQTDASGLGLGAVLYQKANGGTPRPIAFASHSLSRSEHNYPTYKLEFLAHKWAVCDRFHEYLYAGKFDVYTDNNPLTYINTTAKLDAVGQRWVAALASYKFDMHYQTGKTNTAADALSHIKLAQENCDQCIPANFLTAISTVAMMSNPLLNYNTDPTIILKGTQRVTQKMFNDDWKKEPTRDPYIGEIIQYLQKETMLQGKLGLGVRALLRHHGQYILRRGRLYKKVHLRGQNVLQFMLPNKFRKEAMEACHDNIGHLGVKRSYNLL